MKRDSLSRLKIGLVYDLRNDYLAKGLTEEQAAEFDAESTIESLERAILFLGHEAERVGHGRALCRRLVEGGRWDLVFTIAEGFNGRSREAQVPALLEMFGQGYTFSDPLVCAVTLDKAVAKRIAQSAGMNTPAFRIVADDGDLDGVDLSFPLFAKPIAEGTSKGINHRSRVDSPEDLRPVCRHLLERFAQPVLVEEYLPGREFTTAILGTGPRARVLGTMEVCIQAGAPATDYSFEVKERCEEFVEYRPLDPGALRGEVDALALAVYRLIECRDAGRVDIRLDRAGRPAFLEINPLPGLHPAHSDLPIIAAMVGVPYVEMIRAIIESAAGRYGLGVEALGTRP